MRSRARRTSRLEWRGCGDAGLFGVCCDTCEPSGILRVGSSRWSEMYTSSSKVDLIIVGGGSAGALLASRLSANPDRNVLLIERGRDFAPGELPPGLVY